LAAICLRSLGRVRLLVEDHLLCERLDAEGYPVHTEPVKLGEALEEALARKPAEPAVVEVRMDPELTALSDRPLLVRLLEGVLAAAAPGVEVVLVEAVRSGPGLQVRIRGGPPGSLEKPQKGAPSDPRGRALALPTARRVAAALGGTLTVADGAYLVAIPAT
jgi:hypothetical protein